MDARLAQLGLFFIFLSCEKPEATAVKFGPRGSLHTSAGKGTFRFGTASASTQIEDNNPHTDWYQWTAPAPEGLGKGTFVGNAIGGFTQAVQDVDLAADMGLDAYRFSLEWARMEPQPGAFDDTAFNHYELVLNQVKSRNLRPMVTLQHFSFPRWANDATLNCVASSTELGCGLQSEASYQAMATRMLAWVAAVARKYGDRVDEWCTLNEPINYILASHATGLFPPGKSNLDLNQNLIPILRRFFDLHARMVKTLRENDTIDADNDGHATSIGLSLSVLQWVPARDGQPSSFRVDVAAKERLDSVMRDGPIQSFLDGAFDSNLDGTLDEPHPEWRGTLDWVGVQNYSRAGVTGSASLIPSLNLTFCFEDGSDFGAGACIPPEDESYRIPTMQYSWGREALYSQLIDLTKKFPNLPLVVTENGLATQSGQRRSELLVRSLENILRAQNEGADVRGYYHWTLVDNFEWHKGYAPAFGLFRVDRPTLKRIPTSAVETFRQVAENRRLNDHLAAQFGGRGPLSVEEYRP